VTRCQDCPFNNSEWMSCNFDQFFDGEEELSIYETNGISDYSGFNDDETMPDECPLLKFDGVQIFGLNLKEECR